MMKTRVRPASAAVTKGQDDIRSFCSRAPSTTHRPPTLEDLSTESDAEMESAHDAETDSVRDAEPESTKNTTDSIADFYGLEDVFDPYKGCEFIRLESGAVGTECGFYRFRITVSGYKRWEYRCGYREKIGNRFYYCTYHRRDSSWQRTKEEVRGSHAQHHIEINEVESCENDDKNLKCLTGPFAKVYKMLARNVCIMNMSLRNGSSLEMFQTIWGACDTYHKEKLQPKNAQKLPSQMFKKISPETLRSLVIEVGSQERDNTLESLCGVENAVICLDAGLSGTSHVISMILNYRGTETHLLTLDVSGQVLNGAKYAESALKALTICQKANIHILCFVGDGLQAQVNGLSGDHTDSFQRIPRCGFKNVFFIPCFLHKLNLTTRHAITKYVWFSEVVNAYHSLTTTLRRQDARPFLPARCPLLIKTRWVYLYDVVAFISSNEAAIKSFIPKGNPNRKLIQIAQDYQNLFAPLKALVLTLSGRQASIAWVYPCVIECIAAWRQLNFRTNGRFTCSKEDSEITWISRLRNYYICDTTRVVFENDMRYLLMLAYALSLRGHDELWFAFHPSVGSSPNDEFRTDGKWLDWETLSIPAIGNDSSDDDFEDTDDPQDDDDDETVDPSSDGDVTACATLIAEMGDNIYDGVNRGLDVWFEKYSKESRPSIIADVKLQLVNWLNLPPSCIYRRDLVQYGGIEMWDVIRKTPGVRMGIDDQCFTELAHVAVKVLSIPASEISCEREFSLHKHVMKDRCGRSGRDLIDARINILETHATHRRSGKTEDSDI